MSYKGFSRIERKSTEILNALAQAPVYKKTGTVQAERALAGVALQTILKDGKVETQNTAKDGDWLVTNPEGEQYLVANETFLARYEPTDVDGVYGARGFCRAIKNPFGVPIQIMAEWGTAQDGDKNCIIADTCDAIGKPTGEPYLIALDSFEKTYALFESSAISNV